MKEFLINRLIARYFQARSSSHLRRILNSFPEVGIPAPPPDYDTVLKDQEKEEDLHLPSYSEVKIES